MGPSAIYMEPTGRQDAFKNAALWPKDPITSHLAPFWSYSNMAGFNIR